MKLRALEWRNLYSPFSYLPKDFAKIKPREILSRQNSEIIIVPAKLRTNKLLDITALPGLKALTSFFRIFPLNKLLFPASTVSYLGSLSPL